MPVEQQPEDMSAEETTALKIKRETDKQRTARMSRAWETVLADPAGRAVVWDILGKGGMFSEPIVLGDTHATYVNLGRAQLARQLYSEIGNAYPARLLQMEQENMR